jgi:hypothetical protein
LGEGGAVSLAESVRRQLEDLLRSLGDGVRSTPFSFFVRREKSERIPKAEDGKFVFAMDLTAAGDDEPQEAPEPTVYSSPYDEEPDKAPATWEEAKRRNYGSPREPGSTSCEPGPERKVDEFKTRLNYPSVRADADPSIIWPGAPRKDELKEFAREIAGQRTFHRPHQEIRPRSVERQIKDYE